MKAFARNRPAGVALGVLALGLVVVSAHMTVGVPGLQLDRNAEAWLYNGVVIAAGLVCLARTVVPGERLLWLLLGLAIVLWGAGDIYWTEVLEKLESPPFPSLADALYLAFYPPAYVAIVLLVRARVPALRASLWLDGIISALALGAVGSALVFDAVLRATGDARPAAVATNLTYPLADLVLVGLLGGALALTHWRPDRTWALVAVGIAVFSISDGVFLYQTAVGSYVEGTAVDLGWVAGVVLLACAAWQPFRRRAAARRDGWWLLAPPVLFALVGLTVLVYDHFERVSFLAVVLAGASLLAVLVRLALTFGENMRIIRTSAREARTDAMTGLGNRRKLMDDLSERLDGAVTPEPFALALFDLNGFKLYNDQYGHPAGDVLLARLARNLGESVGTGGHAYRMGGDEFCIVVDAAGADSERVVARAADALSERGEGFSVSTAYGVVALPAEADGAPDALRLADQRMYAQKHGQRGSAGDQTRNVLLRVLSEQNPQLGAHLREVARLAESVAREIGVPSDELGDLRCAAVLHDVGKIAIPDAILTKPGPLDDDELAFVRRHTTIGARIVDAAPALAGAGALVRASHERYDGNGYPDGLKGDAIPLGARIIFVCDAFDAMTRDRPYAPRLHPDAALAELRRCAGTQFDPVVVEAFLRVVATPALAIAS